MLLFCQLLFLFPVVQSLFTANAGCSRSDEDACVYSNPPGCEQSIALLNWLVSDDSAFYCQFNCIGYKNKSMLNKLNAKLRGSTHFDYDFSGDTTLLRDGDCSPSWDSSNTIMLENLLESAERWRTNETNNLQDCLNFCCNGRSIPYGYHQHGYYGCSTYSEYRGSPTEDCATMCHVRHDCDNADCPAEHACVSVGTRASNLKEDYNCVFITTTTKTDTTITLSSTSITTSTRSSSSTNTRSSTSVSASTVTTASATSTTFSVTATSTFSSSTITSSSTTATKTHSTSKIFSIQVSSLTSTNYLPTNPTFSQQRYGPTTTTELAPTHEDDHSSTTVSNFVTESPTIITTVNASEPEKADSMLVIVLVIIIVFLILLVCLILICYSSRQRRRRDVFAVSNPAYDLQPKNPTPTELDYELPTPISHEDRPYELPSEYEVPTERHYEGITKEAKKYVPLSEFQEVDI
eukprot:m.5103 g.5103  ORF g.5103 m.5103 type:complete len:464 (+) comp3204_c0_seq1:90-1481(+)